MEPSIRAGLKAKGQALPTNNTTNMNLQTICVYSHKKKCRSCPKNQKNTKTNIASRPHDYKVGITVGLVPILSPSAPRIG